jgi:hypothetical protein
VASNRTMSINWYKPACVAALFLAGCGRPSVVSSPATALPEGLRSALRAHVHQFQDDSTLCDNDSDRTRRSTRVYLNCFLPLACSLWSIVQQKRSLTPQAAEALRVADLSASVTPQLGSPARRSPLIRRSIVEGRRYRSHRDVTTRRSMTEAAWTFQLRQGQQS